MCLVALGGAAAETLKTLSVLSVAAPLPDRYTPVVRAPLPPLALAAAALLLVLTGASPAHADPVHDLPLPSRSRIADPDTPDLFISGTSFRRTVDFYKKHLARKGLAHEEVPVYRYRGTTVARFLSRQKGASWAAIHVFIRDGRALIAIIPAPLTAAVPQGKSPP